MVMSTTSLADAKARLSELISSAETTHERTVITKNGKAAAVLIGYDDLESLEETIYWLGQVDDVREAIDGPFSRLMSRDELDALRRDAQ